MYYGTYKILTDRFDAWVCDPFNIFIIVILVAAEDTDKYVLINLTHNRGFTSL